MLRTVSIIVMLCTTLPIQCAEDSFSDVYNRVANGEAARNALYISEIARKKRGVPLADAIKAGRMPRIEGLINCCASIDDVVKGSSMLQIAAKHSSPEVVTFLITMKADINHHTLRKPKTALALACRRGEPKMVEVLLDAGAFFYTKSRFSPNYKTPLQELIKGCTLSHRDRRDDLQKQEDYLACLRLLLEKRGDTERFYHPQSVSGSSRWHGKSCTREACVFQRVVGRSEHGQLTELQEQLSAEIKARRHKDRYQWDGNTTCLLTDEKKNSAD